MADKTKPDITEPIYFHNTVRPMVKVGTLFGCNVWVELDGHDAETREYYYMRITDALRKAFGMTKGKEKDPYNG